MKRLYPLTWLLAASLLTVGARKKQTVHMEGKQQGHYLFAYFNDNTTEGQQICYAVSDNGLDFTPLNGGRPVVSSKKISLSGGVRDPHLLRADEGWFYQVATDMDMSKGKWTNRGIVMMRSRDLIHWQHHTVHFPKRYAGKPYAEANAVWAPQTIYDPAIGKYMVYFSLHSEKDGPYPKDAVYYAYANEDFSDLESDPQPLFTYPNPTIDTDIVRDEQGVYHLFFNTWGGPDGLLRRQYVFSDLHRPESWTLLEGDMQPTFPGKERIKSEGSTAYQLSDGSWILSYDCFADGVYHFCKTTDLQHFELVRETPMTGTFTPRHGSVMRITDEEYQRLKSYYREQPLTKAILNGVPWYDQNGKPVSAHGANIIKDGDKYYMFGEYKTDSANVFTGFSCYSSDDLCNWRFERIAFSQQKDGRMGPSRVGERPKVLRCPTTGEYVMLMHSDNLRYKDPCVCYATSKTVNGEYTFQGPLLYKGQPIKKWDIGSFMDDDGQGYLLVHHGYIYRLAPDFHSADSCLMNGLAGTGESPAMFKKDGIYYWLSSHTTSWERNDNMYFTSKSLSGPWQYGGEFAPKGSLTWNSQCSFVLTLPDGTPMYMGDRWSFPRQQSAATYVWLPMRTNGNDLMIPDYWEAWSPATVSRLSLATQHIADGWTGEKPGDTYKQKINGGQCIAIYGTTDSQSGYAEIAIKDNKDREVFATSIDFYSKIPATGLRWVSPKLPKGGYTLEVRVSDMKPNWTDKTKTQYGSTGYQIKITEIAYI